MPAVAIRPAVAADLDAVARLFDQFRQSQDQPSDEAAARAFLRERFERGESIIFLAELEGEAVGFTQLYPMFSSVALARAYVLNDLFVAEAGRRQGVASALLAAAEAYAQAQGAHRLSLNVAHDNTAGQALYAAQGWQRDAHYIAFHRFPNRVADDGSS